MGARVLRNCAESRRTRYTWGHGARKSRHGWQPWALLPTRCVGAAWFRSDWEDPRTRSSRGSSREFSLSNYDLVGPVEAGYGIESSHPKVAEQLLDSRPEVNHGDPGELQGCPEVAEEWPQSWQTVAPGVKIRSTSRQNGRLWQHGGRFYPNNDQHVVNFDPPWPLFPQLGPTSRSCCKEAHTRRGELAAWAARRPHPVRHRAWTTSGATPAQMLSNGLLLRVSHPSAGPAEGISPKIGGGIDVQHALGCLKGARTLREEKPLAPDFARYRARHTRPERGAGHDDVGYGLGASQHSGGGGPAQFAPESAPHRVWIRTQTSVGVCLWPPRGKNWRGAKSARARGLCLASRVATLVQRRAF